MRSSLFTILALLIFISCKKSIIEEEIEQDSYRISILPIKTEGFNEFKIVGSLELRKSSSEVEYGIAVSQLLNPTILDKRYKIGMSATSIDFSQPLNDLDTGRVYYVRAYARSGDKVEYSANHIIDKVSPQISFSSNKINKGRSLTIGTNIQKFSPGTAIKAYLGDTEVGVHFSGMTFTNSNFDIEFPAQLPAGEYDFVININNIKIKYPKKIKVLEGLLERIDNYPADDGGIRTVDHFVVGDWIYVYKAFGININNGPEFSKYNYKTGQRVLLQRMDNNFMLDGAAILQVGATLHFIGGEKIGSENITTTKYHYIYNTLSNDWTRAADFPGQPRKEAFAVLIGRKIHYGMGYKSGYYFGDVNARYTDIWVYDLDTQIWKQGQGFPQSTGRMLNAWFTIGTKLYMTGGAVGDESSGGKATKETWCYDGQLSHWSQKADYPGKGEMLYVNFSLGGYGYVGMGESLTYNSYLGKNLDNEFFRYDPTNNQWLEVSNINSGISKPISGATENQAVIGAGTDRHGVPLWDLYLFTPEIR